MTTKSRSSKLRTIKLLPLQGSVSDEALRTAIQQVMAERDPRTGKVAKKSAPRAAKLVAQEKRPAAKPARKSPHSSTLAKTIS